ncbi:MAG: putative transcriptional regulator [Bacillota bacterium]|nr:putative transcriptional regulator [Bacillota bacterium]
MTDILKALADETRLRIISQMFKGEMCVCEIEECLGLTQSNVSRHLNVLKKAGIFESYKTAQWTYYKISDEFIKNNEDLYKYLIIKIKELPFYEKDSENFSGCKLKNMCEN